MLRPGIKKFALLAILASVLFILIRDNSPEFVKTANARNKARQVSSGEFVNVKTGRELITNRTIKAVDAQENVKQKRYLILGGIFFVPNGLSYVIINGQVVAEKAIFDGILVKRIWKNKVELVKDNKTIFLKANREISFIK